MKNSTITRVVILGAISIIGILMAQGYWVLRTWDVKEKEFHEKVLIAMTNVAREFEKMGSQIPDIDMINQVSSNYYVVNINDVINANNLEFFLQRELEAVGLKEAFEYGIYDCSSREMVYGAFINYSDPSTNHELHREDLPTYDEFIYYFGVRFPNRVTQILTSMTLTLVFSAILFMTILFFVYTMSIILRQRRLSEMQKDFINNMTHEFKTPIATMAISAEVFLNHAVIQEHPRLLQYAGIIKEQNQRLNNQVEKVLQLAKLERENFSLNKEPIQLNDLVRTVAQAVDLNVQTCGGKMILQLADNLPLVMADRVHLTNILHNLLDNAIKYCNQTPEIFIKTEFRDKEIVLEIKDKGLGISKEQQKRIFQKFYRVSTGNLHNVKGFGLGLFYVKNVCQAHRWRIAVKSDLNEGATFLVYIPTNNETWFTWLRFIK